jgi:dsRNA-specific ribonuclease
MDLTKDFLLGVFETTLIEDRYLSILTDQIDKYRQAFTAPSHNIEKNYELYEIMGDSTANEAILWYFYETFPQLRCTNGVKVISRLKINFSSTDAFSSMAEELGFWPYIKASDEERENPDKKRKLLEDVFEAFIGVTKLILLEKYGLHGVGNQFVYNIIKSILDKRTVSLDPEDLFDAKTKLKEVFDRANTQALYGKLRYKYHDTPTRRYTELYFLKDGIQTLIATGDGLNKAAQEKDASAQALKFLQSQGYDVEKKFRLNCEM